MLFIVFPTISILQNFFSIAESYMNFFIAAFDDIFDDEDLA